MPASCGSLGRDPFTQEDPIGLAGGLNAYGFANGDPVDYADPFGLCAGPSDVACTGRAAKLPGVILPTVLAGIGGAIKLWWDNHHGDVVAIGIAILSEGMSDGAPAPQNEGGLRWPETPAGMDKMLKTEGTRVPDGPNTPGRNKVTWTPNANTKITYEEHPYHPDAPEWHKGPHWHLDTPGAPHVRYLPRESIPGSAPIAPQQ